MTATEPALSLTAVSDDAPACDGAVAPLHAPYAADSRTLATWAAYRRDWTQWQTWLADRGVQPDDATPSHGAA